MPDPNTVPNSLRCPVCRAEYRASTSSSCRRCGVDLSPLIQIYDQSIWHYQQAIVAFEADDFSTAQQQVDQAIALNSNSAPFHTFAGQLWALQGEFDRARSAWKIAAKIDSRDHKAQEALQHLVSKNL